MIPGGNRLPLLAALLCACLLASSCSLGDMTNLARIASGDTNAAVDMARSKAIRYATNPSVIQADYKRFKRLIATFRKAVRGQWGAADAREAQPKRYVKYTQNYLSRASVDFENGRIVVETLDSEAPLKSLREAIVTTLLTPYDPRAVDMYSSGPVPLGGRPFLLGEVKDARGRDITTEKQALEYARALLAQGPQERPSSSPGKTVRFVVIPMVRDHLQVRAVKFKPLVEAASRRFGVSRVLIYAVIRVESDFNPYAINSVPAIGLMQVVPRSAGADVHRELTGRRGEPDKAFLFDPENNITYGTAYLSILSRRHLAGVTDPVSREYCVIASYNGGSGALLKTFSPSRAKALAAINGRAPTAVYDTITTRHAAAETRQYLRKVLEAKKQFVGL